MSELCSLAMWASGRKCCPDCSHPTDVDCAGCGAPGDPLLTAFQARVLALEWARIRRVLSDPETREAVAKVFARSGVSATSYAADADAALSVIRERLGVGNG